MKKIALSFVMIAASGGYALKEAAVRYDWFGQSLLPAMASQDALFAASPTLAASSAPIATIAAEPPDLSRSSAADARPAAASMAAAAAVPEPRRRPATAPALPAALSARPIENAPVGRPTATGVAVITPPNPTPAPPPSGAPKAAGAAFRDGTFTGLRYDAYWGTVQVRAVVKDGKLSSVDVLDFPSDRRTSQQINRYALPILQREVVQAQGVNVNIISGATLTAKAYLSSLRSALQQAQ
jgi:uncharacterized protein with FMN-binding domain